MTTATVEKTETDAPITTDSPPKVEDVVSVFYGPEKDAAVDTQPAPKNSPATSETGSTATSEKASAVSTEKAKTEDSAAGTAEKKDETKETKGDEGGHQSAARRLGNEVKAIKTQLDTVLEENKVLQAKVDGTYKEPEKPTPQQIEQHAEFIGREKASRTEAERLYGAPAVKEHIYDPGSTYEVLVREKPWLQRRVMAHPQPTLEAMRILDEQVFVKKYGDDPKQWVSKIEAELEPKLLEKFKQQTQLPPTGKEPPTVSETRGSSVTRKERSIEDVFYGPGSESG